MTGAPLLKIDALGRRYGTFHAVAGLSLSLDGGQVLALVGPNGAGKSTTLKMLATLELPTSGEAWLEGRSLVSETERVRPRIGYMPERPGVYRNTSVREDLDFFARAYGLRGALRRARIDEVIAFVGLSPIADRLCEILSKGMRQRLALGRMLLNDPALLLLDEPADGLDPRARIELRELLRVLAERGKAIVVSSHVLTELSEVADRCAILEQGRLVAGGSLREVTRGADGEGSLRVELGLLRGPELDETSARARRHLLEQPGVMEVALTDRGVTATLTSSGDETGDDAAVAGLVASLVSAGLPLCAVQVRQANLEDVFLKVTRGEVA